MSNNNYYITEKGYKRQKCSLYLQKKVYEKLSEISEKNELSISECGQRLMVQSMGLNSQDYSSTHLRFVEFVSLRNSLVSVR